ncbi:MAG: hypothetical protein PWR21_1318 [Methanoculleus sp.]|nr:hypothetical protein [Methanoculleus sp.]
MKQNTGLQEGSSFSHLGRLVAPCVVLLLSLLMMRMITLAFPHQIEVMPLRLILGFGIIFSFIIPILLVYKYFRDMDLWLSVTVPFIIYAVLYPVFKSVSLGSVALLCETTYIVPLMVGGLGLAFIGCGSYVSRVDRVLSKACFACGILIFILKAPNVISVSYFVFTGDDTLLRPILNF